MMWHGKIGHTALLKHTHSQSWPIYCLPRSWPTDYKVKTQSSHNGISISQEEMMKSHTKAGVKGQCNFCEMFCGGKAHVGK
jgi:hypothetical protein